MCLIEFSYVGTLFSLHGHEYDSRVRLWILSPWKWKKNGWPTRVLESRLHSIQDSSKVTLLCTTRWVNQSKLLGMENTWLVKKWWRNCFFGNALQLSRRAVWRYRQRHLCVWYVWRSGVEAARILSVVSRVTVGPRFIELVRVHQQTFCIVNSMRSLPCWDVT